MPNHYEKEIERLSAQVAFLEANLDKLENT
jgi:cell division protein FtsB